MKKTISLVLALVFVISLAVFPVSAMSASYVRSSGYIEECSASITKESSTSLKIGFTAYAPSTMTKLGASTIYLFCDGTVIASYTLARYPSMSGSNVSKYSGSVTYTGASSGHTYYAQVFFQATDASGSGSDYRYTNSITF